MSGRQWKKIDKPGEREYLSKMAGTTEQNIKKSLDKPHGEKIKVASAVIGMPTLLKHPAEDIVEYAEKEKVSLIVMATHGRTGIRRWALGSTAEKVVRIFKSPVLLVRANDNPPQNVHFDNILVPLDGSIESEASLAYIENLASSIKTKVKVLHVLETPYHIVVSPTPMGFYGSEGMIKIPYNNEELKPLKEIAEKYIKGISEKLTAKGIKNSYELRVGSAAQEITEAEAETKPDLVVMATHGTSGFSHFDFGSVADKVLHTGATPIMLIRPAKK